MAIFTSHAHNFTPAKEFTWGHSLHKSPVRPVRLACRKKLGPSNLHVLKVCLRLDTHTGWSQFHLESKPLVERQVP